ncbi:zinc metalloproteinase nas-4-like [Argiope bruennichi]|uniref:zinc metalloproteinase nas-4-like n=1 Tax=Argiope bruennichi TaxID=94029 RepID=UPI002494B48B|nr:zinc metalloproteinase nas-4-like [Argiope bruennichi]
MIHLGLFVAILLIQSCSLDSVKPQQYYPIENYKLNLFQGDILLGNGTFDMDRFAVPHKALRWPDGTVPYILDDIYSDSEKELIRSAMDEFEKQTCIKWVERTDEDSYVEIFNDVGCYSDIGRTSGRRSLSLESPICMRKGTIMHELMHALGFLHEHSRADRDDYVDVVWDNIVDGRQSNFEKYRPSEIDTMGLDYDYRSVMHYEPYMYAADRNHPTLKPSDHQVPLNQLGHGQAEGVFTDLDIEKIKTFYEC